jgi:NADPH-dependent 7-cyano-7-deazaguanine reductase QueF
MVELGTVPNEKRCLWTKETHYLDIPPCCPVSGNPIPLSTLTITYEPQDLILEVASLRAYINSFQNGRGAVRSMEGMIQTIAQDAANALRIYVKVKATLTIKPHQTMILKCTAAPN